MTTDASRSDYNYALGALEHNAGDEWTGALAFTNICLTGSAFTSNKWYKKHNPRLLDLFTRLLMADERPQGLLLSEVGNIRESITAEGKSRLEDVVTLAFQHAGAVEHGAPQFFWSSGDTMAAFKAGLTVEMLDPLTKMKGVASWRAVDRFKITGTTEHGECHLLTYNTHQPKSRERPFSPTQRINFCKAILRDAIRDHGGDPRNIGFGFGGDANCDMSTWTMNVIDQGWRPMRGIDQREYRKRSV